MSRTWRMVVCGVCLCAPAAAQAAGFALAEQGAAHQGLAGATVAREEVGSAGFSNPAAYGMAPGLRAMVGVAFVAPTIVHAADGATTETESGVSTLPQLHVGGAFETPAGRFGGHVALFAPYGSRVVWPDGWSGRYEVQRTGLQVVEVSAGVTYSPARWLSVSAGPRLLLGSLETSRDIDVVDPTRDTSVEVVTDGQAWGWQVSVMSQPVERLTLGASWRSGAKIALSGTADFQDVPIELSGRARDTRVTATLPTPHRVTVGGAWDFGPGSLSLDIEYFSWSVFESLVLDFEDERVGDVTQQRRWEDTVAVRVGWEHRLVDEQLRLRAGGAWDPSPGPTDTLAPSSPDTDRVSMGLGAGWCFEDMLGLSVDGAVGYTALLEREVSDPELFAGSYSGRLWTAGVSVGVAY